MNPKTREDAILCSDCEDVLFDYYQWMRYKTNADVDLDALALVIEVTTIYDRTDLDRYYRRFVQDE